MILPSLVALTTLITFSLWDMIKDVNGDSVAFRVNDESAKTISYDVFRENSMSVANLLTKHAMNDEEGTAPQRSIGILVRNSAEAIMMIDGTYLANSTSVILDIDKTPIERINLIFQDSGVKSVLVLDKEEDIVRSLHGAFAVISWEEAIGEGKLMSNATIEPPSNANHPFSIFYTR